jgi:hypothetical protein
LGGNGSSAGGGGGGGVYGGGGGRDDAADIICQTEGGGGGGGSTGFAPSATGTSVAADASGAPSVTITYSPPSEGGGSTPTPPTPVAGDVPPRFISATITRRLFRVAPRPTAINAAVPRGTTFRYRLSEAARVTILIERVRPGRRVGRRCVRPTRANRRRPRCTRYVLTGTLTRRSRAGQNTVAFSGRIGRRALSPGSYRATLQALDSARQRSRLVRLSFRVVRG